MESDISRNIESLAKSNKISSAIIQRLKNTISDEILLDVLQAIITAPSKYYLRLNLLKEPASSIIQKMKHSFPNISFYSTPLPNVISFPIQGPNQFPLLEKRVTCDKFAAEAVMMGANLFVPGIKNICNRFPRGEMVSVLMDQKSLSDNFEYSEAYFHVGNGIAQLASKEFPLHKNGTMIESSHSRFATIDYRNSELYASGYFSDQNFPAIIATSAFMEFLLANSHKSNNLNPLLLDICSAPGHKTCAFAEMGQWMTKSSGSPVIPKIVSIDRSSRRLENLRKDLVRLSLPDVEIIPKHLEKCLKQHPEFQENADFLMFDPPCSALGTRPKLFLSKSTTDLEDYPKNQHRLFKVVTEFVKPGGYLMYNTCTIPKEENEDMVAYAVSKLGYKVCELPQKYYQFGQAGVDQELLSKTDTSKIRRFLPKKDDGVGYFIALLQKSF